MNTNNLKLQYNSLSLSSFDAIGLGTGAYIIDSLWYFDNMYSHTDHYTGLTYTLVRQIGRITRREL